MSTQRECYIYRAKDDNWYMRLGNFEYAYDAADCTTYGPFASEGAAVSYLDNFSNPGGWNTNDSGTAPVPKNAVAPRSRRIW